MLFDPSVLARLATDVAHPPAATAFADRYLRLLPGRIDRVLHATAASDDAEAMDAVLSLKSSSLLVGAVELADLALRLERDLRRGGVTAARTRVERLPATAARCRAALADYLSAVRAGTTSTSDSTSPTA